MSDPELRVAVVGARGHFSIRPGIGPETNSRFVGIAADGYDDEARKLLEQDATKGLPYFDDYRQMIDATHPNVVSVGAQPAHCGQVILAALERGISVVSDKPVADTNEELARMRTLLGADANRRLVTEFTMRLEPAYMAMHDAVRAGKIGEPILVQAQKSYRFGDARPDFYKTRKGYPGTIIFAGSHIIDLCYWVTGLKYDLVQGGLSGNLSKKEYGEFDDHGAVLMRLSNGGTAVMHMDYLRPKAAPTHGDDRMRIAGSRGVIEVRDGRCVLITPEEAPHDIGGGPVDHKLIALEIIETLRGRGKGVFGNAESLYIGDVLLRAREAADTARAVKITA